MNLETNYKPALIRKLKKKKDKRMKENKKVTFLMNKDNKNNFRIIGILEVRKKGKRKSK